MSFEGGDQATLLQGSAYFGEDVLENIDNRNRPKVANVRSPYYLGDKSNDTIVYMCHVERPDIRFMEH